MARTSKAVKKIREKVEVLEQEKKKAKDRIEEFENKLEQLKEIKLRIVGAEKVLTDLLEEIE